MEKTCDSATLDINTTLDGSTNPTWKIVGFSQVKNLRVKAKQPISGTFHLQAEGIEMTNDPTRVHKRPSSSENIALERYWSSVDSIFKKSWFSEFFSSFKFSPNLSLFEIDHFVVTFFSAFTVCIMINSVQNKLDWWNWHLVTTVTSKKSAVLV